jgi:homoserine dehydrogenase
LAVRVSFIVTRIAPRTPTRVLRIAFVGYGSVNRALAALLDRRRTALARDHGITYSVTGVASRSLGWRADAHGIDPARPVGAPCADIHDWLAAARPDAVFEAIALDPNTGQPALDYLRAALQQGAHAISANKGPLVHGYRELSRIAAERDREYRFEAAVMDGAPVFSLVRECLPLAGLCAVRGVFTSTATIVLEAIEYGSSIDEGIARAQQLGIAEADPTYDIDGWDSAVKLCALANVLLDADLRPTDVQREGIRSLSAEAIRQAHAASRPYRLVGEVRRDARGAIRARVAPTQCDPHDPLGTVRGATLVMHYEADVFPGGLTVTSHDPDPTTTAYGMLADLVAASRKSV